RRPGRSLSGVPGPLSRRVHGPGFGRHGATEPPPPFGALVLHSGRWQTLPQMPLHWTIDSKAKFLAVVAEGVVTQAEFESYLDLIDQAGLHAYRKLFDGIDADTSMGPDQILAMGVRMRTSHQSRTVGPLGPSRSRRTRSPWS